MKKSYETPVAEKIEFNYMEQVVASGHTSCLQVWINVGENFCADDNKHEAYKLNP